MAILETSGDFYNLLAGIGSCAAVVVTLIIFIISSIFRILSTTYKQQKTYRKKL